MESPPFGKHPWTTSTPESCSFAFTRPPYMSTHVSVHVHLNLILPRRPLEAAYAAGVIASHVSE